MNNVTDIRDHERYAVAGEHHAICIKPNNFVCNEACATCGRLHRVEDPGYFLEGTWESVCGDCASKFAPSLVAADEFEVTT